MCSAVQFEILNVNDSVEDSASFITNEHAAFDSFEAEWPPKNSLKQVEYEKYWYKINQYDWYNGIFGHV